MVPVLAGTGPGIDIAKSSVIILKEERAVFILIISARGIYTVWQFLWCCLTPFLVLKFMLGL